ncbi:hypothetical protein [Ideonella sp.]|jgi:hypothetical protein|uniref:hypothetical protein n=1 Tax=Ideonella sp. TaxID=1929293 RepID=UPI0037C12537
MGQVNYKIPRVTDAQIHRSLQKLSEDFGQLQVGFSVGDKSLGQIVYPEANDPKLAAALAQNSELISYFAFALQGVTVSYHRGGSQGSQWEKSHVFDDLAMDLTGIDEFQLKVMARTLELFRPVQLPPPSDSTSLLEAQRALQESSFSRLQLQLEKVFEQTIELRGQLDEQVRHKEAALEQNFQQREVEATERIQRQIEELSKQEQALEERRKSLDESDNTFARRQIRDRMLSDVAARVQNFGLSASTVATRKPVAAGMLVLCALLTTLLSMTLLELDSTSSHKIQVTSRETTAESAKSSPAASSSASATTPRPQVMSNNSASGAESAGIDRIMLWIRFALLSTGLAASILYYIRWQNQWATSFAATEQSLQQFHIDVNRANWVVETCLEWRKETDSDIPTPLIESLTRGLFVGRETTPPVLHPADELASALMGSASHLSLDINGNKLDIKNPGKIPKTMPSGGSGST